MPRTSWLHFADRFVLVLALGLNGCAAVGLQSAGSSTDPEGDVSVAFENLPLLDHGTPLRVTLAGGGSVRGFYLGLAPRDSAGHPATPLLILGTGNSMVVDLKFNAHQVLVDPTRSQIPDTLRFASHQVADLGVPEGIHTMPTEEKLVAMMVLNGPLLGTSAIATQTLSSAEEALARGIISIFSRFAMFFP